MTCSDPQEYDWPEPDAVYHVPSFSSPGIPLGAARCLRCQEIIWLDAWLNDEPCPATLGGA